MTFLEYLSQLSSKEYKVLLVMIDKKYGWLACHGSSPGELLFTAKTLIESGKRRTYPKGKITEEKAHNYIINHVIRSLVGHEYEKIKRKLRGYTLISIEQRTGTNDDTFLLEISDSKDKEPVTQLLYLESLPEIRKRVEAHPRRQPRLVQVFDLFVYSAPIDVIIKLVDSKQSTIYEDKKIITGIIENYLGEETQS